MPECSKNHIIILDGAAGLSKDEISQLIKSKADDIASHISSSDAAKNRDPRKVSFLDWEINTGDISTGDINIGGLPGMFG